MSHAPHGKNAAPGMRLALVIASLGDGGAERVMSLLANYWADRGENVTLITLETTAIDAYLIDSRITRVALGLVKDSPGLAGALSNNWRRIVALRHAIHASGASAVLSFEDRTNVLVVFATAGLSLRRVLSERTDPTRHPLGMAWRLLRRLTYPLADAVVVQTRRLLPWARTAMLGRKEAYAIPNPLRVLGNTERTEGAQREPAIVALGRLWHEKGYDILIRAFAAVAGDFPGWTLTIIGEGPEREALTVLARSLEVEDRLFLPGWLPVPEEVLSRAAFFVMPSRYEGFPNALLEAMGAGLPVISSACGGSEEMISEGSNGLVVALEDAEQLAGAMRRLMHDPALRSRMGVNAYAVSQRYAPRTVMPMWDAVLSSPCLSSRTAKSCL